ncbi:TetR/AcrR family transcriptional regulator [Methylomonas sp. MgM2]
MNSTNLLADKPARERILLTAHDLFYRDGIRATGIDKVIAEAKVTKVTFYRHFPSKNDLVRAFLDYRHQVWIGWFKDALKRHGTTREGLMALIPVLSEWFENPIYRGCAFINIAAELGRSLPEALSICRNHKQDMVAIIAELLPPSHSRMALADAAAIAVDGAIVRAQMECGPGAEKTALIALSSILQALAALSSKE